eukprot:458191_1
MRPTKTTKPTKHPTITPTDAWDKPLPVASSSSKPGKNGRKKPQHDPEEQGFDALIQSANANRGIEQNCIIFYDCADVQMMHQLERDLITREYGNELIIVRNLDYHGLSKDKSIINIHPHKFQKVKEYYTDPYYLAQHLLSFEDCFVPSETALNGTVTRYTYNVHHIKQWIGTVIQFIAVSTNKTRQLFNVIDDLVTVRHRVTHHNANSSLVHVLLVFMREIFRTAPDLLKQRQHKHRNQRMNKPMMEPPDVNPRIFHSARVMRAVLDFYAISCLSVIEMICKQVTDSFTSWATHSFVVNVTSWRHNMEQYRLDLSKRLHHTVGLLDRWLELSIDDEIVHGPSSDVMDELLEFGPLVQGWSDYGNTVEIAKMIYDWKRIKQLNAMNIHIPRVAMNDMEFEFMYNVLQELRYTIRADDLKIKRFNVTYLKKSPGPNKGKTRNKSPDQTMKLFNKYTLSEMPIRLGNITIQNENQGNVGVNTITTYESEDESVLEQLEQDLSRKCLNELVIITQWELEIDNATSQLHIGPDTFTRVKQCHDATDFAFYKFIEVWSVHFLLLIKTPVIAPQHLHPTIIWLKQLFYSTATESNGMAANYRVIYRALAIKYANGTSKQQDMLNYIATSLEEGSRFASALEAGGEDPHRQITELNVKYPSDLDSSVMDIFFHYYWWSWSAIIEMQKNSMISKFSTLQSMAQIREDARLVGDQLEIAVHLLIELVVGRNITTSTLAGFARANRELIQVVSRWQALKLSVNIANIVGEWKSSKQLRNYNIHIPRLGVLKTDQWEFFGKLLTEVLWNCRPDCSQTEISRHKVRLLTKEQQRQIKTKKKGQQRHLKTLLDKYHLLA